MKPRIPEKIKPTEWFRDFVYSALIWISVFILIIGLIAILYYYFIFILNRDFTNPAFFQASVYLVIGSFLVLFVHDEKCRNRILGKKKK